MKGFVGNVQRGGIHDGPGIRTVVFLKGCPLYCIWCQNPELQKSKPELMFIERVCSRCGTCVGVCPNNVHFFEKDKHLLDRNKCQLCGRCTEFCPTGALKLVGRWMTVEEVMKIVAKDKPFYKSSGGGVTISGGEPLYQPEFTSLLVEKCLKSGVNVAIETCGFAKREVFSRVIEKVNLVLFDLKAGNELTHLRGVGSKNEQIINNLEFAANSGAAVVIRIPLIPDFNDNEKELYKMAKIVSSLSAKIPVQFLTYHNYGIYKYGALGRKYEMEESLTISKGIVSKAKKIFRDLGIDILENL